MNNSPFYLRHRGAAACVALLAGAFILPSWAPAQFAPAQVAPQPSEYALRTYEVSDLVLNVPDYPYQQDNATNSRGLSFGPPAGYGGGMGGGGYGGGGYGAGGGAAMPGAGMQAPESDPARITMDDLLRVVTGVVAPDEWSESGGNGEIQRLGTALVVWQKADVHEHIRDLLEQLRAESGQRRTVSIDARWLLLNSDELDEMLISTASPASLNREVLDAHTRRPSNIRGVTNCFSGQLVYIVGGTRRNFVSGQIPVVGSLDHGSDEAHLAGMSTSPRSGPRFILAQYETMAGAGGGRGVGYQPIIEKTDFGALLQIRPTVMKDGKEAIVNVISTVTAPVVSSGADGVGMGMMGAGGMAAPAVDRVAIEIQEIATTFRVPLGQAVLVGGLTHHPRTDRSNQQSARAGGASPESRQLYLILEVK